MIYLRKSKRKISRLIFHHFGEIPPKGMNVPKIRQMHIVNNGWDDIGYHAVIMPDGSFSIGRPIDEAGAHTWSFNSGSIGIMFMAGIDRSLGYTKPTKEQLNTARAFIKECRKYYGNNLDICGHKDLRPTECPGFDVKYWVKTGKIRK